MVFKKRVVVRRRKRNPKRALISKRAMGKIKRLTYKCNVVSIDLGYANWWVPGANGNLADVGFIAHLSAIAQGSDFNQRRGNAIEPKLLHIRITVGMNDNSAGAHQGHLYRFLVVQGTKTAANTIAFADLFEDVTNVFTTLSSHYNNDNVKMKIDTRNSDKTLRVLADTGLRNLMNFNGTTTAGLVYANAPPVRTHTFRIPASKFRQVEFSGTAGNTYLNTPIFLVGLSDCPNAQVTHGPQYGYTSQLYFDNVI